MGKLYFIKIRNFGSVKESVKRRKKQATDGEKIFANNLSGRLTSRRYEGILTTTPKYPVDQRRKHKRN